MPARLRGLSSAAIRRAVEAALADRTIRSINVAVVDDATMADLHERYLGKSGSTDVLSFDLRDDENDKAIEGEIVVSAETARRVAGQLGLAPAEELLRYTIHGALHLAGQDDRTTNERKRMRQEEDRVLAALSGKSAAKPRSRGQ
jgi:probable rRNA maturation factor